MGYLIDQPHEVSTTPDAVLNLIRAHSEGSEQAMGYRGQRIAAWALEPTLTRYIDSLQLPTTQRRSHQYRIVQKRLHDLFCENVLLNGDLKGHDHGESDLWQYGQHQGLPTPLLDWSHSPYIALFFALCDEGPTAPASSAEPRSLWAINLDLLRVLNQSIVRDLRPKLAEQIQSEPLVSEQLPEMEIIERLDGRNKRMAAQRGFSTKHVHYRSFEIWAKRIAKDLAQDAYDTPLLTKWTFVATEEQRVRLLRALDDMNINSRTLFPDIKGSVDYACFRVRYCAPPSTMSFSASRSERKGP